ncbi:MAG: FtsX-like permease family protein [Bdellovibrionia bacterium]
MKLFFSLIKIAWRNVRQNRRKSRVALLAIASGYMSLNLFQGYISEAEVMFEETYSRRAMYGDLIVTKSGAERFFLDDRDQRFVDHFLKNDPATDVVVRGLFVSGLVTNGRTTTVFGGFGHDIEAGRQMRETGWEWNTIAGKPLYQGTESDVVIGKALGAILDCEPKLKFQFLTGTGGYEAEDRPFECHSNRLQLSVSTASGQLNAADVNVFGIMDAIFHDLDLRFISMPLETAQTLMDTKNVSQYTLSLRPPRDEAAFMTRFREGAKEAGVVLDIRSWTAHPTGEYYVKSMEFLYIFRDFIVVVIIAIALLSVLNTLIRIIQERTREIGTMRSIGFKAVHVKTIFVWEAFFLSVLGTVAGLILSLVVAKLINSLGILYKVGVLSESVPFKMWPTWTQSLQSGLILIGISVVASIFPTTWAMRKKITECLADT